MKYYKIIKDSQLAAIGTGPVGSNIEITKEEYDSLLAEINEKAGLVDKLYSGEITADDIPAEWQEEIQRRVDARKAREADEPEAATEEDYKAALAELGVSI